MHTLDKDSQEVVLFILAKLGKDEGMALEVFEEGGYFFISKLMKSSNHRIKMMAIEAFEPLCVFEILQ